MENSNIINSFKQKLQDKQSTKCLLYQDVCTKNHKYGPQDVINSVYSQMKTIQLADNIRKHVKSESLTTNRSNFLPVNKLPVYGRETANQPNFETECVTDTQLINIIEKAEALDTHKGITQEFDITFNRNSEEQAISPVGKEKEEDKHIDNNVVETDGDIGRNNSNSVVLVTHVGITQEFDITFNRNSEQAVLLTHSDKERDNNIDNNLIAKDDNLFRENLDKSHGLKEKNADSIGSIKTHMNNTYIIDKTKNSLTNLNEKGTLEKSKFDETLTETGGKITENEEQRPISPIFTTKVKKKVKPITVTLESFENFENIVSPLISKYANIETAKHIINSQILGTELVLNADNTFAVNENRVSPEIPIEYDLRVSKDVISQSNNDLRIEGKTKTESSYLINKEEFDKNTDFTERVHKVSPKDEIIFSSDEELDYVIKEINEIQDLPLTCALETSFYDVPNVLETTMYVGFQTASNKSIEVNTESFVKAKSLLDDKHKEISITELVKKSELAQGNLDTKTGDKEYSLNVSDEDIFKDDVPANLEAEESKIADKSFDNAINSLIQSNQLEKLTAISPETITNNLLNSVNNKVGFTTASNKEITFSKDAYSKCKDIFKDINFDESFDDVQNKIDKEKSGDKMDDFDLEAKMDLENKDLADEIDVQELDMDKINDNTLIEEFSNIEMSLENNDSIKFDGFQTASNKNIKISDEAKTTSKNLFQNILNTDNIDKSNSITIKNVAESGLVSFRTASNKNINISDKALAKSKNIFNDIKFDDSDILDNKEAGSLTKKTNSNTKTGSANLAIPSTSTGFQGFKTGNNTIINLPKSALDKAKNIFKDIDFNNQMNFEKNNLNKDFYSTNERLSKRNEIESISKDFVGFKTANNKPIVLSNESLARSKKIFENLDSVNKNKHSNKVTKDDYPVIKSNEEESLYITKQKEKYDDYNKAIDFKPSIQANKHQTPVFEGFKTASNKQVEISKESLEKCKKIFDNIELSNSKSCANEDKVQRPIFEGFQTANKKPVAVSKESLKKSKELFNDIDGKSDFDSKLYQNRAVNSVFKGFQTANKKPVAVSEESLKKSKDLFKDIDSASDFDPKSHENKAKTPVFEGFQTANKKPVAISEESLKKCKDWLKDIDSAGEFDSKFHEKDDAYENKAENLIFKGFQTANKKVVAVSKESLKKGKDLFKDIASTKEFDSKSYKSRDKSPKLFDKTNVAHLKKDFKGRSKEILFRGLQVASNKKDEIYSEKHEAYFGKPKKDFGNKNVEDSVSNEIVLDTQLQNNFEENFDLTQKRKCTSPILPCPRAKKRKFETPYKTTKIIPKAIQHIEKKETIIKFTENYKKRKVLKLQDLKFTNKKVDSYLTKFTLETLLDFEFYGSRNELTNKMDVPELKKLFKESLNKNIIPENWLDIQIKLILWKLISYEAKYSIFVCTLQNVIDQLKYRYDRELYNVERPILRKIYEKDDLPSRTMILCVAGICENGVSVTSVTSANNIELLLTDGWYFIKATLDKMLSKLVHQNRIVVGCKIVTKGAELLNCEQGIAPWEDTSQVRLKLSGNSTRLARTHTKLGCNKDRMISSLSSVNVDGGSVPLLKVCVAIVYPMLYLDKLEDGNTVTRSERLEHLYQMEFEAKRESMVEKIYEQMQQEFEQESQDSENTPEYSLKRKCLDSGSQIAKLMKRSRDPMEFKANLTSSQLHLLQEHTNRNTDRFLAKLQDKIKESVHNRKVVTLLRARIVGVDSKGVKTAMLSIWKPNDAILDLVKEGSWIEIMNVVPTAIRNSELQLSAGRQSLFRAANVKEETFTPEVTSQISKHKRKCYSIEELSQITSNKSVIEIDTAGLVFSIEPKMEDFDPKKDNFQNVFLADADKNMISVNFWGGIKKFGYQSIIENGQVIAFANLQRRVGNSKKSIPQFRVTELSVVTKTPKFVQSRNIIEDISRKISKIDLAKFCEDCLAVKNNYTVIRSLNFENDLSVSKNISIRPQSNPNSFLESSFKQTENESPNLLRKKILQDKIDKLKKYGEPPPLSPISLINKSKNATGSYKSPLVKSNDTSTENLPDKGCQVRNLLDNVFQHENLTYCSNIKADSVNRICKNVNCLTEKSCHIHKSDIVDSVNNLSSNVASINDKQDSIRTPSPILNRTYVRPTMNPVKLNFTNNASKDDFAEDFEGSPPLSLE